MIMELMIASFLLQKPIIMIQKITFYLIIISITFFSCSKKCRYLGLGSTDCVSGYNQMENTQIKYVSYHEAFNSNNQYIITSDNEYDSIFTNEKPVKNVDFHIYSLIGVDVVTDWGHEMKKTAWLCDNESTRTIRLTVKYSLSDQCAGSGIYSIPFSYWAIIPKLADDKIVEFLVIDVNPFDY